MAIERELNTPNALFMQALADEYSLDFPDRIDELSQRQFEEIANGWFNIPGTRIAITEALHGLITEQTVDYDTWENPLKDFERDQFRFGETEQEIFVNFAKGYRYNPFASVSDAFAIYRAHVLVAYHHINWEPQYAVTISTQELRKAVFSEYGLQRLTEAKIASIRSGYNWDSYIITKQLVDIAYEQGHIYPVHVDPVIDRDTADSMLVELQYYAALTAEPEPLFNVAGATSHTQNSDNLVLIMTARVAAQIGVRARANAFNEGYLNNRARQIVVTRFQNPAIQAVLVDMRWWHIRMQDEEMSEQYNAAALYRNHFLTAKKMVSYSPFYTNIVFTTDTVQEATAIAITGPTSAMQGTQVSMDVTVTGATADGTVSLNTYDLELEGAKSAKTTLIPGTTTVLIGDDETATTLTVVATLRQNDEITASASITVTENSRSLSANSKYKYKI